MVNFILFDDQSSISLRPLTFFRPVSEIRVGILTIREKWEKHLQSPVSFLTEMYLQEKFPLKVSSDNYLINGSILPNQELIAEIMLLNPDTSLQLGDTVVAIHLTAENLNHFRQGMVPDLKSQGTKTPFVKINNTWDIFGNNEKAITDDFKLITHNRKSAEISSTNQVLGNKLFVEEGASIECSSINTLKGPVYIGKHAEVMQGCHIEGPVALCDHSALKMGALVYKGTTLGPWCKAGGEISNSVLFGYSSKAHDGFLGNSVIAEWCNLGAGTTNSNLKNNYEPVKQWSYSSTKFVNTGLQFCGLVMGDHCKTGISTMFNSGTTTGVCSNIFGANYQRNFIPSFVWGGTSGFRKHKLNEAMDTAKAVYARRSLLFDTIEENIFKYVFELTSDNRFL
ncbi:MAG: putative sugar nucleotidyl transferase [Lentimicrobiaceae bacterium]|jgi:UDP-N-acetylglucosamine diphosphorylase/glucosamine-1-phosphate N-acetyltransferase